MCGRFILVSSPEELEEEFELIETPEVRRRYNIAPSQEVAAVRSNPEGINRRELKYFKWGLTPFRSKGASISQMLINARAETIDSKPVFKSCFRKRRILIPTNGFYEWVKDETGAKHAYLIHFENHYLFAFAGIYDEWKAPSGEIAGSCAIITAESNDLLKTIHDRMPVIVKRKDYAPWLETKNINSEDFRSILAPYKGEGLRISPVSSRVNKPEYDAPDCIEPLKVTDSNSDPSLQTSLYLTR